MNSKLESLTMVLEESQDDIAQKWLTFWLQEQLFGVAIAHVEQIVSMQPITAVPEYPPYVKGIINQRGAMIPVIDLRMRLGKPEVDYTDHTCIIINNVDDELVGFIVDEVDAVIDIPAEHIAPPPKMGADSANRYLTGIARVTNDHQQEMVILCLNAAKILFKDALQALTE